MHADGAIDHRTLYRLPWSLTDNVICWLEPTKVCNIHCEGCYSANVAASHKSLEQVDADLDTFLRFRRTDAVSIAGGDPLTHPSIVEIVRRVAAKGLKPVVNTNGLAMTDDLMAALKAAGLRGVTFHVDSHQKRPGWTGKSETELHELRAEFAARVARVKGVSCAFNATVYEDTLEDVPRILEWGRKNIDRVHVLVFIAFRAAPGGDGMSYWAGDRRVDVKRLVYGGPYEGRTDLSAHDIVASIRTVSPDFAPCAYLNGTEKPDSFKWLMTLRLGDSRAVAGYAGPKFAEISQVWNHLRHGRYLGYVSPKVHRRAKWMLPLGLFDRGVRRAGLRWLSSALKNPLRLFRRLHLQSVMLIQPVDVLVDGRMSMCDACPDVTVDKGELVWSCRLEERLKYGQFLRMVPAAKAPSPPAPLPAPPAREPAVK